MGYNKVILEGRLVTEPELKKTQSGVEFCTFTMAVDRAYRKGEDRQADFPSLKAWRSTAVFINKHFHKGDPILVDGKIETSKYEDAGKTVYRTDVIVDTATFTISKKSADAPAESSYTNTVDDGDLPF